MDAAVREAGRTGWPSNQESDSAQCLEYSHATSVSDGKAEYRFASAMAAVEKACGGAEETAKQIAGTSFKVALISFAE